MNQELKDWLDSIAKILGGLGFFVAAVSYRTQQRIRRAEWHRSLYEKFFENATYKEVRVWLDYGTLNAQLNVEDKMTKQVNEEKFTDFLNFFEFIGGLFTGGQLTFDQINDLFDYYLKKIKLDPDCGQWIEEYSFDKLKLLLAKLK
jgi:hypothetical protein